MPSWSDARRRPAPPRPPAGRPPAGVATPADDDRAHRFTRSYQKHYVSMVRMTTLLVGDQHGAIEVVNEAMRRLHRDWNDINGRGADLDHLHQTIVVLARRYVVGGHAAERAAVATPADDAANETPTATEIAAAAATKADDAAALRQALGHLPYGQREVLVLRHHAGLLTEAIGQLLGEPTDSVRGQLDLALESLRERMAAS